MHVVMDETAMVCIGAGNRMISGLIHLAHNEPGWYLYAPTRALIEADRERPGIAEHIASLPKVRLIDLDLPAALALGKQDTWAPAHAAFAAMPNPEFPNGGFVATTDAGRWDDQSVRVLDLGS